ncbi:hypothetical protein COCNU_01G010730 [Cocos nucifera]|uniref:Uncharacterized protein n=1 Tax=Cocos nucifera TaxID=13894 RepID=A0A8K0HVZ3_COCNU|nr:hypothetical protein COCNU_01G010730 [Cocos nucifera]
MAGLAAIGEPSKSVREPSSCYGMTRKKKRKTIWECKEAEIVERERKPKVFKVGGCRVESRGGGGCLKAEALDRAKLWSRCILRDGDVYATHVNKVGVVGHDNSGMAALLH